MLDRSGVDLADSDAPSDGLVGYWSLDEFDGQLAIDGSTFANHGAIVDATHVPGRVGDALSFDGETAHVALGNPDHLALTGAITVSAWVSVSETGGFRNIVAHGHTNGPDGEYFLRVSGDRFEGGSWDGRDHKATADIAGGDLGVWIHLASVYDGATWILYRDGEPVDRRDDGTGAVPVAESWAIGARGTGSSRFFAGLVDEVYIYDRALDPAEIRALAR